MSKNNSKIPLEETFDRTNMFTKIDTSKELTYNVKKDENQEPQESKVVPEVSREIIDNIVIPVNTKLEDLTDVLHPDTEAL